MHIFPTLTVIQQPDNAELDTQNIVPEEHKDFLIIYDGGLPFVERVLNAAGYDDPSEDIYLIRRGSDSASVDLSTLLRQLGIKKVILFGQKLPELGLHFDVAHYVPLQIAGYTYMVCDSVTKIEAAKAAGDNGPSRDLWNGIKLAYTKS